MKRHIASVTRAVCLVAAPVMVSLGGHASAETDQGRATIAVKQSPFACDRLALTPERRKRHFDVLGPALIAKRTAVRALPDGYEIAFPADATTYQEAAEYVDGERLCCPFFHISLDVTPEGGPLLLRFTGRPGTKQFIEADGAEWIRPVSMQK
jgi:hypothetical protein